MVNIANGVAIAARVRKIANPICRSLWLRAASPARELGTWQLWPVRLSETRPQEAFDFVERTHRNMELMLRNF